MKAFLFVNLTEDALLEGDGSHHSANFTSAIITYIVTVKRFDNLFSKLSITID